MTKFIKKYQEKICLYCVHFIYHNHNILDAECCHKPEGKGYLVKVKPNNTCVMFRRAMGQTIRANIIDLNKVNKK